MAETALGEPEVGNDDYANHNGVSVSPDDDQEYHGHHNNYNNNNINNISSSNSNHHPHPHPQHHPHHDLRVSSNQTSVDQGSGSEPLEPQPRYLMSLNRGKISNFYVNGDKFFAGKKIVHNPKYFKDMPHYLDYLTDKLEPRFGAIRKICTPKHGSRILSLQDIRENCDYVVVGSERFKPYQYDQITPSERKKSPPFKYDADPVVHNRRLQQSGKINKIETRSKLIKVWPNGDDLRGPRRVLLSPRINPYTLGNVIAQVNEIMKEDCLGTVEKLFFLNGIKVSDIDQISHNGLYVACRKTERFKNCRYNESGTKNLSTSPRLERKFLAPLNSRSNNSTQSSPEHSNASTQNSVNGQPSRRRGPRREEDQVFPARPVKHTRSSEKNRNVDLDKDQGGLFKAKQSNRTTHGAREIQDSRHTRTELPVDQRQAKTVEEEAFEPEDFQPKNPAVVEEEEEKEEEKVGVVPRASHAPAYRRQEEKLPKGKKTAPRNGPAPYAEARANSKRTPPAAAQKKDRAGAQHDDMERQKSAAKIQAGYRGFKTRQELKSNKRAPAAPSPPVSPPRDKNNHYDNNNDDNEDEKHRAAATIQAGIRGHQSRNRSRELLEQQQKAEAEKALKQEDTLLGEEERAAAKIQAGFRGFQTRQTMRKQKMEEEAEKLEQARRDEEDRAAAKIQAGYRGYSSRKNTFASRNASDVGEPPRPAESPAREQRQDVPAPREDSYDSLDREIEAATKIQSSYRGYVARKEYSRKREAAVNLGINDVSGGSDSYHHDLNPLSSSPNPVSPVQENQSQLEPVVNSSPHPAPSPPLVSNEEAVDRYRSSRQEKSNASLDVSPQGRDGSPQALAPEQEGRVSGDGGDAPYHGLPEQGAGVGYGAGNTPPRGTRLSPSAEQQGHLGSPPEAAQNEAGDSPQQDGRAVDPTEAQADKHAGKQNGHAEPLAI